MSETQPIHLIYAADGGFAMPLAVSLHSVLRHLTPGRSASVYVVDGGFTPRQRRRIERAARRGGGDRSVEVTWVPPDPSWWGGVQPDFSGKHLNETVLYRLGVTRFLPESVERAIYIDADVLAKANVADLERDIDPEHGVSAVADYSMSTWGLRYQHRREPLDALGLTGNEAYFNAGVLGISVAHWRRHDTAGAAVAFLERHRAVASFYDQDALNYVLRGRWRRLHPGWNFPPTCRDKLGRRGRTVQDATGMPFDQLQREAKLVHFTGAKPWHQGYTNPERPAFVAELRRCGWFSAGGYAAWSLRWHLRLVRRAVINRWTWKTKPRLERWLGRREPKHA